MNSWKSVLKADPLDWLLEDENPSVRYLALRDISGSTEDDSMVRDARREIMRTGMVCDILRRQQEPEYIKAYRSFYTNKYRGLVWQLIVLAELGADINPQIREQCEYILTNSQDNAGGGFAMNTAAKTGGGRVTEVIPCLSGNMVWSLIHFGYLDDPRLQRGIDWITRYMRFNDGVMEDPQVPPYDRYDTCWGKHTCHMGVIKALKALGAIPAEKRTAEIDATIQRAVEFVLIHHVHKRSHDPSRVSKPGWLRLGFPLMYQTDALEILDVLTALGVKDGRMDEAIGRVIAKQDDMGRWKVENTYASDRLLIPFEQKDTQSKWITLRAVRVLKRYRS